MAESELSVDYSSLMVEVAAYLGYGSDSAAWSDNQRAEADRYVQSGVRMFYYPPAVDGAEVGYEWSFLSPTTTLTTTADDQAQDLNGALGRVKGDFFYDESEHKHSIVQIGEGAYQALISRSEDTGPPQFCRVRHKVQEAGQGQRLEVAWWPIPDDAYVLTYEYEAYSGKLSEAYPYPLGGMRHAALVEEACLAVAEQRANDERGLHTEEFERLLKAAIKHDRRLGARYYGAMGQPLDHTSVPDHIGTGGYTITYNGVEIT